MVVLDSEMRIITASHSFYSKFQVKRAETEGRLFNEIGQRQWEISSLRKLLEDILLNGTTFEDFRVDYDSPNIGHKALLLNGRKIAREGRQPGLILLAMEDITASLSAAGQGEASHERK
jgi:two-component system, chemotaxis family, CheB/CheR fusion protein